VLCILILVRVFICFFFELHCFCFACCSSLLLCLVVLPYCITLLLYLVAMSCYLLSCLVARLFIITFCCSLSHLATLPYYLPLRLVARTLLLCLLVYALLLSLIILPCCLHLTITILPCLPSCFATPCALLLATPCYSSHLAIHRHTLLLTFMPWCSPSFLGTFCHPPPPQLLFRCLATCLHALLLCLLWQLVLPPHFLV
jgi:hypothetical protein